MISIKLLPIKYKLFIYYAQIYIYISIKKTNNKMKLLRTFNNIREFFS